MVLGGIAYKNLRRKGSEKYRKVYWLWVAKPIRNCDRKVLNGRPPPFRDPPGPSWAKVAHFIPVEDRGGGVPHFVWSFDAANGWHLPSGN